MSPTNPRRRYRSLLALPAWGLYRGTKLVAAIRAETADRARMLMVDHGQWQDGDTIEKLPRDKT